MCREVSGADERDSGVKRAGSGELARAWAGHERRLAGHVPGHGVAGFPSLLRYFPAMPRAKERKPVEVPPGKGRTYAMGPVTAVFKADGDETRGRYSISEWWLEPYTR